MQFAAAEEHLRAALASGATLATRADAASSLGRCAGASGGRSAGGAADALSSLAGELWPVDPERSLELGAELLMVATAVPHLRPGLAARLRAFGDLARGRPGFEAVARIVGAQEQLCVEPAAAATDEVQAALWAGLPPAVQPTVGLSAIFTLVVGERHDLAALVMDVAMERARREGHATRQGSYTRCAPSARSRRVRWTMRRSRRRPGCCWWRRALRRASARRGGDDRAHRARRAGRRGRAGTNRRSEGTR